MHFPSVTHNQARSAADSSRSVTPVMPLWATRLVRVRAIAGLAPLRVGAVGRGVDRNRTGGAPARLGGAEGAADLVGTVPGEDGAAWRDGLA